MPDTNSAISLNQHTLYLPLVSHFSWIIYTYILPVHFLENFVIFYGLWLLFILRIVILFPISISNIFLGVVYIS